MQPRTAALAVVLCGMLTGCRSLPNDRPAAQAESSIDPERTARLPPIASPDTAPIPESTPADSAKFAGPLDAYPWRQHPFSGGYQVGWITGDPFERGAHDVPNGFMIAKRYGWDLSDYLGIEARLADSWLSESDRFNPTRLQTERALFGDLSVMYYPLASARLRPYTTMGAGLADFAFVNENRHRVHLLGVNLPFGVGVKYPIREWFVLRAEMIDNFYLGGDALPPMNNVSISGGVEIRFGDLRKHLSPWLRKSG